MREPQTPSMPDRAPGSTAQEPGGGLTAKSLALLVIAVFVSIWWVQQTEIIVNTGAISESTPPIPAIALLILFTLVSALWRRITGRPMLRPAELLAVYIGLTFGAFVPGHGVVKRLFPSLGVPGYFQTPENDFGELLAHIPGWVAPTDRSVLQGMYEGVDGAAVPWAHWAMPLAMWTLMLVLLFVGILSLVSLFQRRWCEEERLSFPLLAIPVEITRPMSGTRGRSLLADPAFWCGVGVAALYNLSNILHAINPNVTNVPPRTELHTLFQSRPWTALAPLWLDVRLELLGLGYLVNTDVSLTYWATALLQRLESVAIAAMGYEAPAAPYSMQQGTGSYLVLAGWLVIGARTSLGRQFRAVFRGDTTEDPAARWRWIGLIAGWGGALWWLAAAGLRADIAAVFLGFIAAFALVYARVRAETGMPNIWSFPFMQASRTMIYARGSAFLAHAGPSSVTMLGVADWLGGGYYLSSGGMAAEGLKLARDGRVSRRAAVTMMGVGLVAGLVISYWAFLTPFYRYGANVLEGGTVAGGYTNRVMVGTYGSVVSWLDADSPVSPENARVGAIIAGAAQTLVLIGLRWGLVRFPLSPLGFGMASILGDRYWAMFLVVWAIKRTALWVGGVRLYRRLIPTFLGIAIGHFVIAGVVWGIIGRIYEEFSLNYFVGYG
ncbi:MAG: hypothetical protein GF320_04885 [Armatimonadia bacterium]|nr:hypothetical protein [Armatimonadia bacterium]